MAFWNNKARKNNVYDDEGAMDGEFEYQDEFDDQEEDDEFGEEPYVERNFNEAPQPQPTPAARRQTYAAAPKSNNPSEGRVLNIHATAQLQVIIRKPETIEDAEEIADSLLERNTVIVNLENTNKEVGRRILDFLSGVSYANHGALTKVAHATFMVTPYNVGIIGQDVIGELENSGVFFG
jgi:cell division inhibitor SepF